jgi:deoxyribodipyrimidine photo-lyase
MVEPERIQYLNHNNVQSGDYVLYWMQASQRVSYNHALSHAISEANRLGKPLLVYFGLTPEYPLANSRSLTFMLQGLQGVRDSLLATGAGFHMQLSSPDEGAIGLAKNAVEVVVDRDYQRLQRSWRIRVARAIKCPLIQVESNVVVPVEVPSQKEEYTAGTLRPKIHRHLERFLVAVKNAELKHTLPKQFEGAVELRDLPSLIKEINADTSVGSVDWLQGGQTEALRHLKSFIKDRLDGFDTFRNDPAKDYLSNMSPYLHFGQISPVQIALAVMDAGAESEESFLEELIVRRELSMNFVYYNPYYDSIDCLPNWAKNTLTEHSKDHRPYTYSCKEFEHSETADPYWNAAQKQMVLTGKMHGYMRMYWGKKILEWSKSPRAAYEIAVHLNDKYELDGRDPNGYAGIAWCFGKHDRAWSERAIFGKVRYMNDKGLERKFKIEEYAQRFGF